MLTLFAIDEGFVSDMVGYVSSLFDDLKLLILLIVGLFAGFYIIEKIIEIITIKTEKK